MMSLAELAEKLAGHAERAKAEIEKDRQYYRDNRGKWKVYNARKQAKRRREGR